MVTKSGFNLGVCLFCSALSLVAAPRHPSAPTAQESLIDGLLSAIAGHGHADHTRVAGLIATMAAQGQDLNERRPFNIGNNPTRLNALEVAAVFGNVDAARALLEAGAAPTEAEGGPQPLTRAVANDSFAVAHLLLEHGTRNPQILDTAIFMTSSWMNDVARPPQADQAEDVYQFACQSAARLNFLLNEGMVLNPHSMDFYTPKDRARDTLAIIGTWLTAGLWHPELQELENALNRIIALP